MRSWLRSSNLTPSPSTVYRTTKLREETPDCAESRRMRALDCHHLSKDLIATDPTRYYLCVIDACTRLAWAEVVTDLKSLTVMFSPEELQSERYQLQFAEVLTDNGSEFAAPRPKTRTRLNGCCNPALSAADNGRWVLADLERRGSYSNICSTTMRCARNRRWRGKEKIKSCQLDYEHIRDDRREQRAR